MNSIPHGLGNTTSPLTVTEGSLAQWKTSTPRGRDLNKLFHRDNEIFVETVSDQNEDGKELQTFAAVSRPPLHLANACTESVSALRKLGSEDELQKCISALLKLGSDEDQPQKCRESVQASSTVSPSMLEVQSCATTSPCKLRATIKTPRMAARGKSACGSIVVGGRVIDTDEGCIDKGSNQFSLNSYISYISRGLLSSRKGHEIRSECNWEETADDPELNVHARQHHPPHSPLPKLSQHIEPDVPEQEQAKIESRGSSAMACSSSGRIGQTKRENGVPEPHDPQQVSGVHLNHGQGGSVKSYMTDDTLLRHKKIDDSYSMRQDKGSPLTNEGINTFGSDNENSELLLLLRALLEKKNAEIQKLTMALNHAHFSCSTLKRNISTTNETLSQLSCTLRQTESHAANLSLALHVRDRMLQVKLLHQSATCNYFSCTCK